jgi:hypothetical protein
MALSVFDIYEQTLLQVELADNAGDSNRETSVLARLAVGSLLIGDLTDDRRTVFRRE